MDVQLQLGFLDLSVEKSRGGGEQAAVLVAHDISNVGRQARPHLRVLQHLVLLLLYALIIRVHRSGVLLSIYLIAFGV